MFNRLTAKAIAAFGLLVLVSGLLAGCAGSPTPAPATPPPSPQATEPSPGGSTDFVPYLSEEGNFTINLPATWSVAAPQDSPLGSLYLLGPTPESGGPASSTVIVADAAQVTLQQALDQLCGGACAEQPTLESVVLNGQEAQRTTISAQGAPALEWYFVEFEGRLVIFSIHDPTTLKSLDEVIQTISFGSVREIDPASVPATAAILSFAAQQLKVDASKIEVLGMAAAEWPNSCLGLPAEGELCAQVITPGYIGMLDAAGELFEFYSDQSGASVRMLAGGVLSARQVLVQQLHESVEAVKIVSYERVEWPDSCLGIQLQGQVCAKVVTPGYKVILETSGGRYEFHTDLNGEAVQLAAGPKAEVGDAAIVWKQTTTVCETAQIGAEAIAFGPCDGVSMAGQYAFGKRATDYAYFVKVYAPFDARTPAGEVSFKGQGTTVASDVEMRMIAEWARLVYMEAMGGRAGATWGLVFAWHREGGIAGFCDDLAVYVTGDVYASSCKGSQPKDLGTRRLGVPQLTQIYAWVDKLKGFEEEHRDPATADAMTTYLVFAGTGTRDATDAEKLAIQDAATQLYAEMSKAQ